MHASHSSISAVGRASGSSLQIVARTLRAVAPSQTNYVETYWSGIVQHLQAELHVMNRHVPHRGEQGRANELSLFRLLKSLLPSNVSLGSGIIFDSQGPSVRTDRSHPLRRVRPADHPVSVPRGDSPRRHRGQDHARRGGASKDGHEQADAFRLLTRLLR